MSENERLIPDGVELKDGQGRPIHEFRLRYLLGLEERFAEEQKALDPIRKSAGKWGGVAAVSVMGDIQIAEVVPRGKATEFHIFLGGESQHRYAATVDTALIEALCLKYDGPNTRLPYYIAKMIGIPQKEGEEDE